MFFFFFNFTCIFLTHVSQGSCLYFTSISFRLYTKKSSFYLVLSSEIVAIKWQGIYNSIQILKLSQQTFQRLTWIQVSVLKKENKRNYKSGKEFGHQNGKRSLSII
eukprot:TRINITY_DN8830_c0_g1_i2.p5 TRINITY_DN8830_c0_g1~~TRINITY_DN8830_c0_g1_i2.p5  ORF type:complete len:106 (+),score=2.44 TRINITY_DN8830_c0_g1_i2:36-353(+)